MQRILKFQFDAVSIFSALGDLFLIFIAGFGAIGSLVTAFNLPVNLLQLALILLTCAVIFTFITHSYGRKWFLISMLPLAAAAVWQMPNIIGGMQNVLFTISYAYSRYLYLSVLFPNAEFLAYETAAFIIAVSVLLAVLLTFAVCFYRSLLFLFIVSAGTVFPVFVVVFTPANIFFLVLLLGAHILMFFRGALSEYDDDDKRGIHWLTALGLSILLLSAAAVLSPYGSWTHNTRLREIGRDVRYRLANIGLPSERVGVGWPQLEGGDWGFNVEITAVADAGTRHVANVPLLEINVSQPGVFYLRGFTQEYFDGRAWHQRPRAEQSTGEVPLSELMPTTILAQLISSHVIQQGEFALADITIRNVGDVTPIDRYQPYFTHYIRLMDPPIMSFFMFEHSISDIRARAAPLNAAGILAQYEYLIRSSGAYMQVDPYTAEGLRRIADAAGINANAPRWQVAEQVAEFIVSSAEYSTTAHITPQDEDFTLFFLERSMMGFCIHFTTAATLMLRALDIPARFTVGFLVTVPSEYVGDDFTVTDRYAHAWVEVFLEDFGWTALEVTPAVEGVGIGTALFGEWDYYYDPTLMYYYWAALFGDGTWGDMHYEQGDAPISLADRFTEIILQILFVLASCVVVFLSARIVSKITRNKRFKQDDTNLAVLSVWQYLVRLRKKPQVPEDIEDLALKARFSLHSMTEDERVKMIRYAEYFREKVYDEKGFIGRLWLRVRAL